jgi:glycosyltransferase involved in cell wall biosynthesis
VAGAPHLIYVTPQLLLPGGSGLPNRPAALLEAMSRTGAFASIVAVSRVRPWYLRDLPRTARLTWRQGIPSARWDMNATTSAIVHGAPFGRLEAGFLRGLIESMPSRRILWVSDPKSAAVFGSLRRQSAADLMVFDAYDAWDLSPLVRGRRRRAAVAHGYQMAAEHADEIFANTPFMLERMHHLGARSIHLLPNAAPPVEPWRSAEPPYLAYLGRIHERLATTLLAAAATAVPGVLLRIAGPLERAPAGWDILVGLPNVRVEPALTGLAARRFLGEARAVLVLHTVDDYTRSQDAMKAWDAIAVGTPVISTPIPPVTSWPSGLGITVSDSSSVVAAVHRVLNGETDKTRDLRLGFAAANGWDRRARAVLEVLGMTYGDGHLT